MRMTGENSSKCAGKPAIPPDELMISPLVSKVNHCRLQSPGNRIMLTLCVGYQTFRCRRRLLYWHVRREAERAALPLCTSECQRKWRRKKVRCPYCVVDDNFRPMTVLPNGRLICKNCGHIVFPNDLLLGVLARSALKLISLPGFADYGGARWKKRENGVNSMPKCKLRVVKFR
jgi:hypothetical protein